VVFCCRTSDGGREREADLLVDNIIVGEVR